jgi:hypothetical protein
MLNSALFANHSPACCEFVRQSLAGNMCKIVLTHGEVGPGTQFWPVLRIDLRCSYELP